MSRVRKKTRRQRLERLIATYSERAHTLSWKIAEVDAEKAKLGRLCRLVEEGYTDWPHPTWTQLSEAYAKIDHLRDVVAKLTWDGIAHELDPITQRILSLWVQARVLLNDALARFPVDARWASKARVLISTQTCDTSAVIDRQKPSAE